MNVRQKSLAGLSRFDILERTRRSEDGDTLIEVLLTVVVMGICAVALITAFATGISASVDHRNLAKNDIILRNLEASVFYQIEQQPANSNWPDAPFYRSCALATGYTTLYNANYPKDKVSLTVPTGYSVTMNPVEYWNGTSFPNLPSSCQPNSPQLISLTVQNPNGSTASTQFVVDAVSQNTAGPTIAGVSPSSAIQGTLNQVITVTGTGFENNAVVSFPGSGISVNSTAFVSSTTLTVSANIVGAANSYTVKVVNPDTTSAQGSSFTVVAPSASLHVSSTDGIAIGFPGFWFAIVQIVVENGHNSPVQGVNVTGTWTPSPQHGYNVSCTTDQNGSCSFVDGLDLFNLLSSPSVSFTVSTLAGNNVSGPTQMVNEPS